VSLVYSRLSDRPLELLGRVESLDPKSGSMLAQFVVKAPIVLTADVLEKYLADKRLGHCYYKFRLHCARNQQYPALKDLALTLDRDGSPSETLEGWEGGSLEMIASVYAGPDHYQAMVAQEFPAEIGKAFAKDWVLRMLAQSGTSQYLMLAFDVGKPKERPDLFRWTFESDLLYNVYSAAVRGTLHLYDGKSWHQVTTFTVDLEPVKYGVPP
jgi:hypothetical protein